MIRRLLRRLIGEPTADDGLAETLAITIRCARRCAYDLAHAADLLDGTGPWAKFGDVFQKKAMHWQSLFSSGTSMKDYRLSLHRELDEKDRLIATLRAELRKLGHKGYGDNEVPF